MNNEEERYIGYKIDTQHSYKVYVSEANGKRFYKVQIQKKNADGTKVNFYKNLRFVKCNPPENGEIIKIKKAFEDLYANNKDPYNAISVIVVMDYEIVDNDYMRDKQAYETYQERLSENEEEVNIDENFLD